MLKQVMPIGEIYEELINAIQKQNRLLRWLMFLGLVVAFLLAVMIGRRI